MTNGPVENFVVVPQSSPSPGGREAPEHAWIGKIFWLGAWWAVSVFLDALLLTSRPDTISFWERLNDSQAVLLDGSLFAIFYGPPAALLSLVLSKLWARLAGRTAVESARPKRSSSTRTIVWTLVVGPLTWYYLCIYGFVAVFANDMIGEEALLELVLGLPSAALWGAMYGTVAGIVGIPIFMLIGFAVSGGFRSAFRRRRARS